MREGLRAAIAKARALLKAAAKEGVEGGRLALWAMPELRLLIEAAIETLDPTPLNQGEQQVLDRIRAAMDPPKTLEELQQPPNENVLGYQRHHVVEQNPDNVVKAPLVKSSLAAAIEKFGRAALDDPSNIVWVPTLKHEQVTGYYNAKDDDDGLGRLRRRGRRRTGFCRAARSRPGRVAKIRSVEMSPEDYAEMSAERLSPHFVDYAKRLGLGRLLAPWAASRLWTGHSRSSRTKAQAGHEWSILAIAAGLLAKPIGSESIALLDHPDPDVRMGASIYLNDADPDLAEATREGVMRGCSASEVIAARQRVRQPPPPRPTLQEMSDEALLARFRMPASG